jgi:1,4-alpha-glucan branching enzyme
MPTKRRPPRVTHETVNVAFSLPAAVDAGDVALCGDFNNWSPTATRLKRGKDRVWRVTIQLQKGNSYRYRFLLDGSNWENDWSADDYVRNPHGTDDSVVNV